MSMSAPKMTESYAVYEITSLGTIYMGEIEIGFNENLVEALVKEYYIDKAVKDQYEAFMDWGGYTIKAENAGMEAYKLQLI